ncbi:hypothetical protein [Paenibacillus sp. WLX2291]|uniref:hypothetical protein n=1 Tax=Paenibacillus sp. WLX2291 TaxID=3296934 RepID=UPI0039845397
MMTHFNLKKCLVGIVVTSILVSTSPVKMLAADQTVTNNVYSTSSQLNSKDIETILSAPKENLTFIKGDFEHTDHLEYTYTNNENTYKIIEDTYGESLGTDSILYKEEGPGSYEAIGKYSLRIVNGNANYTISAIDLNQNSVNSLQSESNTNQIEAITGTIELNKVERVESGASSVPTSNQTLTTNASNPSGLPISAWQHQGNFFYTTTIAIHTINAVNIAIGYIVNTSGEIGKKATAKITGIAALVTYIVNNGIPKIWYTDKVYYKTVLPADPNQFRMKVAEKRIHTFYEDADRTKNMKGSPVTSEFWLEGYSDNS